MNPFNDEELRRACSLHGLKLPTQVLLAELCRMSIAGDWSRQQALSERIASSERSVRTYIRVLCRAGLLKVRLTRGGLEYAPQWEAIGLARPRHLQCVSVPA